MDIKTYLKEKRELIDSYLKSYFGTLFPPASLYEAMKYSIFAGGKRIRPILALTSYGVCGGNPEDIIPQAAAIELIHTYSLIHDDLPAMDDDELRRGNPTNHKVFGEAIAILAGDALVTEAFYMIAECGMRNAELKKPETRITNSEIRIPHSAILRVICEVAMASGAYGMVGGQAQDILSENSEADKDVLNFIHLHKTAALITASVRMGPILADSDEDTLEALTIYGKNIGLAFQIIDDVLDVEGNTEELGKTAGSDKKRKKMTYPLLYGVEVSRQKAQKLVSEALYALRKFSSKANPLVGIADYLIERRA
ncbi:MAG: polyprenyl synthetase [Nitrospirae bacterium RBG_13_39_12]|nr:MAG: polyprenyl synthetase [Nitrospirae bacterium RBG_13_39_12]